jgi:hypothetical protein
MDAIDRLDSRRGTETWKAETIYSQDNIDVRNICILRFLELKIISQESRLLKP